MAEKENQIPTQFAPNPKHVARAMHVNHLGIVLNNLAIVAICYIIFALVGQLVAYIAAGIGLLLAIMLLALSAIATLGIAFVFPEYRAMWDSIQNSANFMESLQHFFEAVMTALPYVCLVGIICAIGSILCIKLNKYYTHTTRFVVNIIAMVVMAITFVGLLVGGVL